jgi:hypothetical protein
MEYLFVGMDNLSVQQNFSKTFRFYYYETQMINEDMSFLHMVA